MTDSLNTKDAEGNWYCTGVFGDAGTWMTQNLRTKGTLTEHGNPGTDTSLKYYWYPGSSLSASASTAHDTLDTHPEYGLWYTWAAASGRTGATGNESSSSGQTVYQGICPNGWHLPSDYEWSQLESVIAVASANTYSTTGTLVWDDAWYDESGRGEYATKLLSSGGVMGAPARGTSLPCNAGGFDALPCGRSWSGIAWLGLQATFWTSSAATSTEARRRGFAGTVSTRSRGNHWVLMNVRCKAD
ncbi:MAG: fibrobacter succinogenes major paralogous domain-containing protein [Dysgonamonadaceae bacterium]|nr:fibrobacter succinogenes major paralogous domain-containing protein [Dysgonamonadaceae bacterium]